MLRKKKPYRHLIVFIHQNLIPDFTVDTIFTSLDIDIDKPSSLSFR